jgi:glycosyltransferase involved in cell wall biosynthesis
LTDQLIVSVIINNYNYEQYLAKAIDSALSQTYQPLEVVVVDDGSTDCSRQIINGYGDRITPVLKENGGQASAFNTGFEHCRGDVVIFLDADDCLLPEAVTRIVEVFQANPDVSKVHYRMDIVDEYGKSTGEVKPPLDVSAASGDLRLEEIAFPFDLRWLPTSGNAFASWALRKILPVPVDQYGPICADYYLVHMAALYGQVCFIDQVLACYRVHGDNSFDVPEDDITLPHIRQSIHYIRLTDQYLKEAAIELGLRVPSDEITSVSEIANRFISLKCDPEGHSVQGDTTWKLLKLGITASLRRFDVSLTKRWIFIAWFIVMALAPHGFCWDLAQFFYNPHSRGILNRLPGVKAA